MQTTLLIHITGGALGLVSGYVALYATKGMALHRRSGMVFVIVMLTMSITGAFLAALSGEWVEVNVPAGLLTAYLVITGLMTVRPAGALSRRWLTPLLMLAALAIGIRTLTFGFEALAAGGNRNGIPAFPFLLFGVTGMLAGIGDLRVILSKPLEGAARLARHLWRMCFALFIAAMSFFLGQADEFPEALRIPGLLALPVLAVLVTMLYWLWRVRARRPLRGLIALNRREVAR